MGSLAALTDNGTGVGNRATVCFEAEMDLRTRIKELDNALVRRERLLIEDGACTPDRPSGKSQRTSGEFNMLRIMALSFVCLCGVSGVLHAGEPIDRETVSAWEKLGAEYGGFRWFRTNEQADSVFTPSTNAAKEGLPGFQFSEPPKGGLGKLPIPAVPFGLAFPSTTTDEDLKGIASSQQLTTLDLGYARVSDSGLKELASLKQLTKLNLAGTKVTDAGLKELANLKQLTKLDLSCIRLTDAGLKELASLKQLTKLDVGGTIVTDAGLKELTNLKQLTTLYLSGTQLTDVGLKELSSLKQLTKLDVGGTIVTDAGAKELAKLQQLTTLVLWHTKVTDAAVKELASLKYLTTLYLGNTQVTDAGLKELQTALPKCKIIN
jgi:hypothetical protein